MAQGVKWAFEIAIRNRSPSFHGEQARAPIADLM